MSQNGILIRIMCLMESFQRPATSVPSDALTIASTSRRLLFATAFMKGGLRETTSSIISLAALAHAKRADKFSC